MSNEVTQTLNALSQGDRSGIGRLMSIVYDDLRSLAAGFMGREAPGHSFQATDLVNEVFLKLVDQTEVDWQGRTHFLAVGAQAMRRILVDHARTKRRKKRGGRRRRLELREDQALTVDQPDEILAVDELITRLSALDPVHGHILECRLFGGMNNAEIAHVLNVTTRTVERHWATIRAWVRRELSDTSGI